MSQLCQMNKQEIWKDTSVKLYLIFNLKVENEKYCYENSVEMYLLLINFTDLNFSLTITLSSLFISSSFYSSLSTVLSDLKCFTLKQRNLL